MTTKEEKEPKSTLLIIAEDFEQIEDFDPKNYQKFKKF